MTGVLRQVQAGAKFELQAPLSLTTVDGLETQVLSMTEAATSFSFETVSEPQLLEVDPEFDLFRLLDARETAPSIGQVFGDRKARGHPAVSRQRSDPRRVSRDG